VDFLQPASWADALQARAERPDALPIAGGTDVMVELNFDRRRPGALLDLTRVPELREWSIEDGAVRLGAGVTYARVIDELGDRLPGLAMASRTVGSPQIRMRGTVGGTWGPRLPRETRCRRCSPRVPRSRWSRRSAASGPSRPTSSSPA
jgi:CO/xanthine dehydrogenase FAD-binding subunit